MQQISSRVYGILTAFGYLNSYLIKTADDVVVIDTGTGPRFVRDHIEPAIKTFGKSLADVQTVIITHEHFDHASGLAYLQEVANPATYAHRMAMPVIQGEKPLPMAADSELNFVWRFVKSQIISRTIIPPARVDHVLKGDETLTQIAPDIKVIHLPGHAYGQIGLYLEDEKTLIGGDVLVRLPWGLNMPLRPVSPDWNTTRDSIHRLLDFDIENLCLGHGKPIIGNAREHIEAFARKLAN